MGRSEGGGDDEITIVTQPRDGQIGLDATALIEKLRVEHTADRHATINRRDAVECGLGVAALHQELRERALFEQPYALAHGAMLLGVVLEPVLSAPAVLVFRLLSWPRV